MTFNKGDVAMDNFVVGDVVQPKSGGPKMTVEKIDGESITCFWFDGSKKSEGTFLSATLTKSKSTEPQSMLVHPKAGPKVGRGL
jgi:uncharacterized protein YodC (DUF2158 family)